MSSLSSRGNRLYAKIKGVDDRWHRLATGFTVDQREQAERWVREREREVVRHKAALGSATGPLTVTAYAQTWLDRRKNKTARDDRTRIEKHALPVLGPLLLADVRPRHLRDLVIALRAAGDLAPKTIRKITGVLHTMFESAVIEELIPSNPVTFERGVLPKPVDKDPTWRHEAIYTRSEIEQLLSDERIPIDRRVLYALKFFTGRHTEMATLTWAQYDAAATPLGAINLGDTKSGVPRAVPVHPTLAKVLASWKLSSWEDLYGHKPRPVDLVVPTRNLRKRAAAESQKQLLYDLDAIGLRKRAGKTRNRRGHDLRRTLITLARADGAIDSLLRWITHGPKPSEILDQYSTPPWADLCREIAKLKISLIEGQVIAMAVGDRDTKPDNRGPVVVQSSQNVSNRRMDAVYERPQRDSNPVFRRPGAARNESIRLVGSDDPSQDGESMDQTGPRRRPLATTCDVWLAAARSCS